MKILWGIEMKSEEEFQTVYGYVKEMERVWMDYKTKWSEMPFTVTGKGIRAKKELLKIVKKNVSQILESLYIDQNAQDLERRRFKSLPEITIKEFGAQNVNIDHITYTLETFFKIAAMTTMRHVVFTYYLLATRQDV